MYNRPMKPPKPVYDLFVKFLNRSGGSTESHNTRFQNEDLAWKAFQETMDYIDGFNAIVIRNGGGTHSPDWLHRNVQLLKNGEALISVTT